MQTQAHAAGAVAVHSVGLASRSSSKRSAALLLSQWVVHVHVQGVHAERARAKRVREFSNIYPHQMKHFARVPECL